MSLTGTSNGLSLLLLAMICVFMSGLGQDEWDSPIKTRIYADEIIDKINNEENISYGPEEVIVGDLAFSRVKNTTIKSDIRINTEIYGSMIANDKVFNGSINFGNSNFYGEVSFDDSKFTGNAIFVGADFKDMVSFKDTIFKKRATFEGIICEKSVIFCNAEFEGPTRFSYSAFKKRADFSGCVFDEIGQFQNIDFIGNAIFNKASFNDGISLYESNFDNNAEFSNASFRNNAVFDSVNCERTMHFDGNPSLRLNGANISGNLTFRGSNIKHIDLHDSNFSKHSQIIFDNCDFFRLYARWAAIKDHIPFDEDVYVKLINYYKNIGSFEDADACYREYNRKSKVAGSPINTFFWIVSDYGTDIKILCLILILSSILFAGIYYKFQCIRKKDRDAKETIAGLCIAKCRLLSVPINCIERIFNMMRSIIFRIGNICRLTPDGQIMMPFMDCFYFSLMVLVNSSTDYAPLGKCRWVVLVERLWGWLLFAILIIMLVRLGLR